MNFIRDVFSPINILVVDINSALGSLLRMDGGSVSNVSEILADH